MSALTSFILQEVTVAAFDRLIRDVGIAEIGAFGTLLAVFLGVSVVNREMDRRTVYNLLSKPLGRGQYLLGKLIGVWATIAVCQGFMILAFFVEIKLYGSPIEPVLFQCFWLMLLEFLVIASFSILSSTFTSPIMSSFMSVGLFVIGHLSAELYFFGRKSQSIVVQKLGAVAYYLLPDLERLNLKTQASLLTVVPAGEIVKASLYALVFVVAFFSLAMAIFSRRDLK